MVIIGSWTVSVSTSSSRDLPHRFAGPTTARRGACCHAGWRCVAATHKVIASSASVRAGSRTALSEHAVRPAASSQLSAPRRVYPPARSPHPPRRRCVRPHPRSGLPRRCRPALRAGGRRLAGDGRGGPGRSGGVGIGLGVLGLHWAAPRLAVSGLHAPTAGSVLHGITGEPWGLRRCTAGGSPPSRGRLGTASDHGQYVHATPQSSVSVSAQRRSACYAPAASRCQSQQGQQVRRHHPVGVAESQHLARVLITLGELVPLAPPEPQRPVACLQVNGGWKPRSSSRLIPFARPPVSFSRMRAPSTTEPSANATIAPVSRPRNQR